MNSQPWLVTGAAGFLGSHVVELLLALQLPVIALDNLSTGSWEFLAPFAGNPLFRFVCQDIRDQAALTEVCTSEKPAVVVHLAALHFIPAAMHNPELTLSLNVDGTRSVLSACRAANVKRVWFASTGDVYKPVDKPCKESSELAPFNIYGITKWTGEKLVQSEASANPECHFIIGRLFNLYGPHETNPHILPEIIRQLRHGGCNVLRLGTVTTKRDLVPVADAARAVLDTIKNSTPGVTTVNIGTGVSVSIEEILNKISELIRIPLRTEIDPAKVRVVERPHLQADVHALQSLIGWTPHADLSRGLHELLRFERVLP
jgi:UDP-glucose 4-epimerase